MGLGRMLIALIEFFVYTLIFYGLWKIGLLETIFSYDEVFINWIKGFF